MIDGVRNPFAPDFTLPPGETLREALEALGMSQAELARRTELSTKHINQIVQGEAAIGPETALALERATGVPASLWNALEANHRQRLMRLRQRSLDMADRAWLASLPIKNLVDRSAMPAEADEGRRYEATLAFFGVASREAWDAVWGATDASWRRSAIFAAEPGATAAWLRLGELATTGIKTEPFDRTTFRTVLDEIRTVLGANPRDYVRLVREKCASAGVAFAVVPEVPGSRANGAARWLSPVRGLIQLSIRYRWEDIFWFSFFHEAGHLLLHGKRDAFVDDGHDHTSEETEADRFAERFLIPIEHEARLKSIQSVEEAVELAAEIGIPPGIVIGRLQHDRILKPNLGNRLRRRLEIKRSTGGAGKSS